MNWENEAMYCWCSNAHREVWQGMSDDMYSWSSAIHWCWMVG